MAGHRQCVKVGGEREGRENVSRGTLLVISGRLDF